MKHVTAAALLPLLACPALGQPQGTVGLYSDVTVEGSILEPSPVAVAEDAAQAARLTVPEGFAVSVFARDLVNPRMLAFSPDGVLYATRRSVGDVVMLKDADGDGRADGAETVASRPGMHGIAFDGDTVFLATVNDVYTAEVAADGSFGPLTRIINDLPDGGQHPNRTLAIGPDGMLYISAGSTCNACAETNPESATLLRAKPDGSSRTIFAAGLRNTIGFDWEPASGQLWGMDHGIDWLGDDAQIEELNHLAAGQAVRLALRLRHGRVQPAGQSAERHHASRSGRSCRRSRRSATPRTARRCRWPSTTGPPSRRPIAATPSWRCAARGTAGRPPATR